MATAKERIEDLTATVGAKMNLLHTNKEDKTNKQVDLSSSNAEHYPNVPAVKTALGLKVDKVTGQGLSDQNYTLSEKNKLAGLESSKYRGLYTSQSALPSTGNVAGSYADVDTGPGNDTQRFIWDVDDTAWIVQGGESTALTPAQIKTMYESNADTNAYSDSEKGKVTTATAHLSLTNNPHSVTKAQVGLGNADNTSDLAKPLSTAAINALALKADDNTVVKLTGTQTVAGAKTFSTVPKSSQDASGTTDLVRKSQFDTGLATKEDVLGNPASNGRVLASTTAGVRSWITLPTGVTTYAALTDRVTVDLPTMNTPLSTALGLKANDSTVVKLTGNQTVGGAKTFSLVPKSSQDASASTDLVRKSQFDTGLGTKEDDLGAPASNGMVLTSTTANVRTWVTFPAGVTTYAGLSDKATVNLPTVNTPLSNALALKANDNLVVKLAGAQSITGKKTHTVVPASSVDAVAANDLPRKSQVETIVAVVQNDLDDYRTNDVGTGFPDYSAQLVAILNF